MPYTTKKGTGKDKGKTCVHKKSSKKKVGCTSGPIEKYLTALRMAESDDMDWMKGPPSFRFGEISRDLRNYFSKGDKVYLTGILSLSEGRDDKVLHLNHEPAIIEYIREDVGVLDLTLGENITSLPIWVSEMGSSYLDLGVFKEDDDMMITVPYKNINESDDLDWIRDTPSNQKVRPWNGNIGYPDADKTSPTYGKVYLYTDDEGVTREIKVGGLTSKHRTKNYKGEWFGSDGEVSFYDASIMSSDIESKNYDPEYPDPFEGKYRITMSRQEYNDNARKGKLILTPNNNSTSSINESEEDFDWASGFTWYKEMLDDMLSDCKTLKLANFNIRQNKPYMSAGGPSIMFLSRCKEWWDYFGGIPLTTSGRGPAEWFTEDNYDDGEYGVIWNPGWGRKKITPQLEDLEHDYTSAITTKWGDGIEKQLNGIHNGESWFVVDEDNRPVYDLIPEPAKGYAKIYEEEFFGDKLNESDDFGWAKEIPGTKEYGQRYRYFEIIACYGVDYETEECDDEYSHYIRIPSDEVDEIWDIPDGDFDYLAGPGDEAEGVIMYAIKNRLIPPGELNEIVMFQGVREIEKDGYEWESVNESKDFDWVKDIEPNWGTYYEAIMRDIEGLPKNLEDVTSEMLLPIWMKIHTINRQILTRDKQDIDGNVDKLFENMGRIEWMFERMMKLVDGETLLMYNNGQMISSIGLEPQEYYNSKKLTMISYIKGMTQQLELLGESNDFEWVKNIKPNRRDSKYYIIDERSSNTLKDGEWFIIEILDRDNHSVKWRSYAWNVEDVFSWRPGWEVKISSPQEFTQLLGLGTSPTYWYPHDGDLNDLPKNHDFGIITQMNESNEFKDLGWISKISSDDYEPNNGDHIEIVNKGEENLFKNWLSPTIWMDYKMGKITNSNGNIEGVVQNNFPVQNQKDNFVVLIKGTKNEYIFLPKRYKINQIKEKGRNPEWYGLDIAYKPIKLGSELKEDSSDSTDWDWAKKIEPKYTKIAPNIYQYGSGSLPRIKVVFKRVEDGEIKTNVIEFDDYEFLDSEEYMNRHFILMGVDDEDNDWLVDGIAYLIGGGEYEWDVNWDSIENNS